MRSHTLRVRGTSAKILKVVGIESEDFPASLLGDAPVLERFESNRNSKVVEISAINA